MNAVTTIVHKELLTYFRSPIAYFLLAAFLLGTGYFFTYNMFLTGDGTMDETFRNMGILLVTLVPLLSMRLFAGEENSRTMELLMTLPLAPWQLVLGKFFGAIAILALMSAATTINLIPLFLYGNPEALTIAAGYLGLLLLGMACIAIGQLFSALTSNQIVAALITATVLLAFWWVGHLQTFQDSPGTRHLFGYLSFAQHFGDFVRGLVRSEGVAFYLLTCAIALTVNTGYLKWRR